MNHSQPWAATWTRDCPVAEHVTFVSDNEHVCPAVAATSTLVVCALELLTEVLRDSLS